VQRCAVARPNRAVKFVMPRRLVEVGGLDPLPRSGCLGASPARGRPSIVRPGRTSGQEPSNTRMAENGQLTGTAVLPIEARLARAYRRHIAQWLWVAHHMIREGKPREAYEAMLSAIWLMGLHQDQDA
jgi:hypothetical protein